ncbi:hypothetical protein K461DRAFT_133361 [Myriangium duriaei CBS 260.36]|uniref:Uncharacterized protein n=1 Tax=Myriangium duriaei CBS 260.36 TaxID=1168546 RepID=A0A9P4MMS4_9PEZI|nr:hypothetical protein K461DRAFT_133361 [Myriangium duriaei CBS 260.36]
MYPICSRIETETAIEKAHGIRDLSISLPVSSAKSRHCNCEALDKGEVRYSFASAISTSRWLDRFALRVYGPGTHTLTYAGARKSSRVVRSTTDAYYKKLTALPSCRAVRTTGAHELAVTALHVIVSAARSLRSTSHNKRAITFRWPQIDSSCFCCRARHVLYTPRPPHSKMP